MDKVQSTDDRSSFSQALLRPPGRDPIWAYRHNRRYDKGVGGYVGVNLGKLGSAMSGTCQIRHALPCPPLVPRKPKQVRGSGIQPCVRMSWRLSHPAPPCRKSIRQKSLRRAPDWRDRAVHLMSSRARAEDTHAISRINSADGITVPIFFSSGHSYTPTPLYQIN